MPHNPQPMSALPELKARLDKSGDKVLCPADDATPIARIEYLEGQRILVFPEGWQYRQDAGLWIFTNHARERRRRGLRQGHRRPYAHTIDAGESRTVSTHPEKIVHVLPTRAICPNPPCHDRVLLLDPETLHVVPPFGIGVPRPRPGASWEFGTRWG
jgi:hypothetical protein